MRTNQNNKQEWKSLQERYESLVEAVSGGMGEREPSQCGDCGLWANYAEEPVECLDCKAALCKLCVSAHQEHRLDLADQPSPTPVASAPTKEKVVFVGKGGVGKTTTVRSLMELPFDERYVATLGVEFHPVRQSSIRDTAGQEKFRGLRDGYFLGAKKIFLFFDASADPQAEKKELLKWYSLIVKFFKYEQVPIVLIGCKADRDSGVDYAKKWAIAFNNALIKGPIFVSNKTGEGMETLREQLK